MEFPTGFTFYNCPIATALEIFSKKFPACKPFVNWIPPEDMPAWDGKPVLGYCEVLEDGTMGVGINMEVPIGRVVEVLFHELAHLVGDKDRRQAQIAAGIPNDPNEHSPEWEVVFDGLMQDFVDGMNAHDVELAINTMEHELRQGKSSD